MPKILVIEDDSFLANAYRVKLEKAEFEVRIANNGQEAFEALEEFAPNVIVLDLIMPVMDGFTFLEKIKQDPKRQSIPVIVASNLGQKEDIDRAEELGATDFVIKSDMALSDLITKIKSLL